VWYRGRRIRKTSDTSINHLTCYQKVVEEEVIVRKSKEDKEDVKGKKP